MYFLFQELDLREDPSSLAGVALAKKLSSIPAVALKWQLQSNDGWSESLVGFTAGWEIAS